MSVGWQRQRKRCLCLKRSPPIPSSLFSQHEERNLAGALGSWPCPCSPGDEREGARFPPLLSGTVTQASSSSHNNEGKGGLDTERGLCMPLPQHGSPSQNANPWALPQHGPAPAIPTPSHMEVTASPHTEHGWFSWRAIWIELKALRAHCLKREQAGTEDKGISPRAHTELSHHNQSQHGNTNVSFHKTLSLKTPIKVSIPGLGRSPGEGNGNPLQYSYVENSMDRGAWWATVHEVAKSWTQLSN